MCFHPQCTESSVRGEGLESLKQMFTTANGTKTGKNAARKEHAGWAARTFRVKILHFFKNAVFSPLRSLVTRCAPSALCN